MFSRGSAVQCSAAQLSQLQLGGSRFGALGGQNLQQNPEELLAGRPLKVPHSLCLVTFITSASPAGRCCSQSQPSLGEGQIRCQIHAKKKTCFYFQRDAKAVTQRCKKQPMKMKSKKLSPLPHFIYCSFCLQRFMFRTQSSFAQRGSVNHLLFTQFCF